MSTGGVGGLAVRKAAPEGGGGAGAQGGSGPFPDPQASASEDARGAGGGGGGEGGGGRRARAHPRGVRADGRVLAKEVHAGRARPRREPGGHRRRRPPPARAARGHLPPPPRAPPLLLSPVRAPPPDYVRPLLAGGAPAAGGALHNRCSRSNAKRPEATPKATIYRDIQRGRLFVRGGRFASVTNRDACDGPPPGRRARSLT